MLFAAIFAFSITTVPPMPALASTAVTQAPAADITPTIDDAPGIVAQLVKAIQEKNWTLFAAMLSLLIVLAANTLILRFGILSDAVRKEVLPWLAAATGMLTSFAGILLAGGGWWTAISSGLLIGTSAIGLWELVGKRVKKWLAKRAAKKIEG